MNNRHLEQLSEQFGYQSFGEPGDRSGIRRGGWGSVPLEATTHRGLYARAVLSPNEPLTSSQEYYDPRKVARLAGAGSKWGDDPKVFEHEDGERAIIDGHHRIVADRLQGRSTPVKLLRPEHLRPARRW